MVDSHLYCSSCAWTARISGGMSSAVSASFPIRSEAAGGGECLGDSKRQGQAPCCAVILPGPAAGRCVVPVCCKLTSNHQAKAAAVLPRCACACAVHALCMRCACGTHRSTRLAAWRRRLARGGQFPSAVHGRPAAAAARSRAANTRIRYAWCYMYMPAWCEQARRGTGRTARTVHTPARPASERLARSLSSCALVVLPAGLPCQPSSRPRAVARQARKQEGGHHLCMHHPRMRGGLPPGCHRTRHPPARHRSPPARLASGEGPRPCGAACPGGRVDDARTADWQRARNAG